MNIFETIFGILLVFFTLKGFPRSLKINRRSYKHITVGLKENVKLQINCAGKDDEMKIQRFYFFYL